ncbi:uncharacterized protein FFB20_13450 [Fusarium fujikuroi]|uniref:Uncharacterized protein n=1 Tax=Gibberella fujikuroi (strain CBS 195.34 / IMI 58289 / NRRL A-6831) TaxID=1279085 RepID=S0EG61_GIBF5|nr:uncharacterized protein FFUJ_08550 [Fusarium fujikuroi IMI 58289]KLP04832.1 uncharacterized protein Y057_6888 [Fusarium fujikuroi]KLP12539.1 uncharacterized protein LW94_10734 [Fusarium fujikuroi]CCT71383.1 uncharacterized protein FFUJ_08550 [Fusarium fujikuroi IMI 58289]SCN94909.1 uncharacterized protein FFE2_08090 [Fusarium fujikuroi]SCO00813.1 uncharacterized protein FFM5_07415 [Fusarium fujikuroi]
MPNSIFGAWQAKLKKKIQPQPQPPLPGPSENTSTQRRSQRSNSQNSSYSHLARWLKPKRRKTASSSTNFEKLSVSEVPGVPHLLNTAEDLSRAFQYSRERWTRNGSSSSNHTLFPLGSRIQTSQLSKPFLQDSEFAPPSPVIDQGPPQLDPLPDMSSCSLERSYTLRACIEAAPDDKRLEDKSLLSTTKCDRITTRPKVSAALTLQPVGRKTLSITRHLSSCDLVAPVTLVGSLGSFNKSGGYSHPQRGQISSNWTQDNSDKLLSMQDYPMQEPGQCSPSCTSAATFQPPTNVLESSYLAIKEGDQPSAMDSSTSNTQSQLSD